MYIYIQFSSNIFAKNFLLYTIAKLAEAAQIYPRIMWCSFFQILLSYILHELPQSQLRAYHVASP